MTIRARYLALNTMYFHEFWAFSIAYYHRRYVTRSQHDISTWALDLHFSVVPVDDRLTGFRELVPSYSPLALLRRLLDILSTRRIRWGSTRTTCFAHTRKTLVGICGAYVDDVRSAFGPQSHVEPPALSWVYHQDNLWQHQRGSWEFER